MAVTRKKTTKKQKSVSVDRMRSFRVYLSDEPFFVIRINRQTFYWLIIGLMALALGIWTVFMTVRVYALYERTDMTIHDNTTIPKEISQ
jgi:predicted lysophospholipase L1 biosynthesis ABC-type transport system permease subunit